MANVRFTSFYNGPSAVYTSPSGMADSRTGLPYLGGNFNLGDYADVADIEARQWSQQFGNSFYQGRYRIVKLSNTAVAASIAFGKPVAWARGTVVERAVLAGAGTGYTPGSYNVLSTGGTPGQPASATVVVGPTGSINAVQLLRGGNGFATQPTGFDLTALGGGTGGSVLAELGATANVVTSFDTATAIQLSSVRGVFLGTVTAAQITAGAYIVIQEAGIASALVTSGAIANPGATLTAATTGLIGATAASAPTLGFLGYALDPTVANAISRVDLHLPIRQG